MLFARRGLGEPVAFEIVGAAEPDPPYATPGEGGIRVRVDLGTRAGRSAEEREYPTEDDPRTDTDLWLFGSHPLPWRLVDRHVVDARNCVVASCRRAVGRRLIRSTEVG